MVCGNEHGTHKRTLFEHLDSTSFNKADSCTCHAVFRYESYGETRVKQKRENKVPPKILFRRAPTVRGGGATGTNLFNQGGLIANSVSRF